MNAIHGQVDRPEFTPQNSQEAVHAASLTDSRLLAEDITGGAVRKQSSNRLDQSITGELLSLAAHRPEPASTAKARSVNELFQSVSGGVHIRLSTEPQSQQSYTVWIFESWMSSSIRILMLL
ncbi:hypothetical protein KEM48_014138 [Puccinia striiformis f. sp. tritici PST-130]|nr:hypothetical protein KEM48_014138 [Puccinia striiformis f. sp. tritici PST-130]